MKLQRVESGEKLKASEKSRQSVILSHRDSGLIVKVDEGVSKQASVNLISQALPRQLKNSKVACDLKATVQPMQILSVSQWNLTRRSQLILHILSVSQWNLTRRSQLYFLVPE